MLPCREKFQKLENRKKFHFYDKKTLKFVKIKKIKIKIRMKMKIRKFDNLMNDKRANKSVQG